MAAAATDLNLKLLVDKECNRVVFAEADKDFIDVIFSFLTLPMGAIVRLLNKKSGIGCIDRIYESVSKLDDRCFLTPACRTMLLWPKSASAIRCQGLAIDLEDEYIPGIYYRCRSPARSCAVSSVSGAQCPCGGTTEAPIQDSRRRSGEESKKGFVAEGVNYIVSDDLVVRPASIGASFALISELGIDDSNLLEKKTVHLSREEILGLLKRSLLSKSPLTDVFLKEPDIIYSADKLVMTEIIQARAKRKMNNENAMRIHAKLFLNQESDQVIYAEASEDLVDLIFNFLTFPLGSIIKLLDKKSSLGCIDNLYKSVEKLSCDANYIISDEFKEMLLSPKLAPYFGFGKQLLRIEEDLPRNITFSACKTCSSVSHGTRCCHGHQVFFYSELNPKLPNSGLETGGSFTKGLGKYMITDDLEVTPLSPITSVHLISKLMVPISRLEEVAASLGEAEALDLLRACLISDKVLTDVFSPYLLKLLQQNWLGSFACKSAG